MAAMMLMPINFNNNATAATVKIDIIAAILGRYTFDFPTSSLLPRPLERHITVFKNDLKL